MIDWWILYIYLLLSGLILVGLGLIVLILWLIFKVYTRMKEAHSLKLQARRKLSELRHLKGLKSFLFLLEIRMTPTLKQFILLGITAIALIISASWWPLSNTLKSEIWIQIYLLILTATLPGVIFILNFASKKSELPYPARALMRETACLSIIICELAVLLFLLVLHALFPSKLTENATPLLAIWASFFSLWLLWKTIRVLINPEKIKEISTEIAKEALDQALEFELTERVANNLLLKLCNWNPYDSRKDNEYSIQAHKKGVIVDVNPHLIRKLINLPSAKHKSKQHAEFSGKEPNPFVPQINIRRSIGFKVTEDTPLVTFSSYVDRNAVERISRRAFKIKKKFAEEKKFNENLDNTREQFINHLKLGHEVDARKIANWYEDIFKKLMGESKTYSASYSDLRGIPWETITGDFESTLAKTVIETTNLSSEGALSVLFSMLFHLCSFALAEKDPAWSNVMLRQYHYIYITAQKKGDQDIVRLVVDKTWMHIRDLGWLHVRPYLDKQQLSEDEAKIVQQLTEASLIELNTLAKSAIDFSRPKDLSVFVNTIEASRLFEDPFEYEYRYREETDSTLTIRKNLWRSRNTCLMGLGGWVIERYGDKRFNAETARAMLAHFSMSLDYLLDIVFHPLDMPSQSRFGWDDWDWKYDDREHGPLSDRQVRAGEPKWVYDLFYLKAVENSDRFVKLDVVQFKPPIQSGIHFLRERMNSRLDELHNQGIFKDFTKKGEDEIAGAISEIKSYLERVEQEADRQDKLWTKEKQVDEGKIAEAKRIFQEDFAKYATLRKIIESKTELKVLEKWPDENKFILGFWDFKDSYIIESRMVRTDGFWAEVAERYANDESSEILTRLEKQATATDFNKVNTNRAIEIVIDKIEQMKKDGLEPTAIIMMGKVFEDWETERVLRQHQQYEQLEKTEKIYVQQWGNLCKLPLIHIWRKKKEKSALMLICPKAIELKNAELGEGYKNLFRIEFDFMDEKRASEVLKSNKAWLKNNKTGKERTEEEALLEIQQHVWVKVYEQFDVDIDPKGVQLLIMKIKE